jgi:hypothetical protein
LKAEFVIHLEKSANNISCLMRVKEDKFHIDFPQRKKSLHKKCLDLLYFGRKMYTVDGGSEKNEFEQEVEITLEENITKAVEIKLENLRSCLQHDLKGIQDQNEVNLNALERKMDMILEKLK